MRTVFRRYREFLTITFLIALTGCTSTEVHTFRNDDLAGKYYDRILLVVDIPNANDRFVTETIFQQEFEARGLILLPASAFIPNLHKMKESELLAFIKREDVHSVLTMTPAAALDLLSARDENPPYRSTKLQWANDLLYFDNPDPVYPRGEDLYSGVYGKFSLKLIDMQTGKVAWLGISLTERTGLGSFDCLIEHNARQTVNALSDEKLIIPLIAADK